MPPSGQMIHLPHSYYKELRALSYFEAVVWLLREQEWREAGY